MLDIIIVAMVLLITYKTVATYYLNRLEEWRFGGVLIVSVFSFFVWLGVINLALSLIKTLAFYGVI